MKDQVVVDKIPKCDVCNQHDAVIDGKTKAGPWTLMCFDCFKMHGIGLGIGKGQELIQELENDNSKN